MKKSIKKLSLIIAAILTVISCFTLIACNNTPADSSSSTPTSVGDSSTSGGGASETSKTWIFEAEDVYISPSYVGPGYSGAAYGTEIVQSAVTFDGKNNVNVLDASNDYYVTYLFVKGATLTFEITSSAAIENATLTLRLAGEFNLTLSDEEYQVKVNDEALKFSPISVTQSDKGPGNVSKFKDYVIGNINLKAGENKIELITNNDDVSIYNGAGTYGAKAPAVDCIKISATVGDGVSLVWNESKGYPFANYN